MSYRSKANGKRIDAGRLARTHGWNRSCELVPDLGIAPHEGPVDPAALARELEDLIRVAAISGYSGPPRARPLVDRLRHGEQ